MKLATIFNLATKVSIFSIDPRKVSISFNSSIFSQNALNSDLFFPNYPQQWFKQNLARFRQNLKNCFFFLGKSIVHPPKVGIDFQFNHQSFNFLNWPPKVSISFNSNIFFQNALNSDSGKPSTVIPAKFRRNLAKFEKLAVIPQIRRNLVNPLLRCHAPGQGDLLRRV